ncbi:hypothetical protein DWU89_19745 [Parabacteroides acidifaciens]|uniref:GLUG domain-containing protein n=2 Tax=Parabacteroides acidifaciens TaxID=2290935 RepID=A0A3D8HA67_9BACT|nr:hypothetical protein DWU89_19745 [Parabacteroides acidifaciens]
MKMTNIMKVNISTYPTALRLLATLFFFLLFTLPAAGEEGDGSKSTIENEDGGDGTKGNPILIATAKELAYFAQQVNDGGKKLSYGTDGEIDESREQNYKGGFSGYYFALSRNIDLAGIEWTPIGTYMHDFRGHFDGQGHVVKGLKVDMSNGSGHIYAGLFGCIYDGTIQNLGVELSDDGIKAGSTGGVVYAGGIVGKITGSGGAATIRNCYVTGSGGVTITEYSRGGSACAGGIAGYVNKAGSVGTQSVTLTHCYATVDVTGLIYTGGIVGELEDGTLSFTYATGKVTGSPGCTGGICGYSFGGSLTNNLALNKEISGSDSYSGRVLGQNSSSSTTLGSNYANPDMLVNGQLAAGTDAGSNSGANTYSDKFKDDLIETTPGNETAWKDAWEWTDGQLPQLKMITGEDDKGKPTGYSNNAFGSQPSISVGDYLTHAPWADCAATSIANSGTGTKDDPILIASGAELAYLAQQVNNNKNLKVGGDNGTDIDNTNGFSDKYFALSDNIDLAGGEWTPIGTYGKNGLNHEFCGHFDGKGHTVSGLKMDLHVESGDDSWTLAGLFGYVKDGTLQNLGVELADAGIVVSAKKGYVYAGGIAGKITAFSSGKPVILRNCYVTGKGGVRITGAGESAYAGGITGHTLERYGIVRITHCYTLVDVEATGTRDSYAGGIAGYANGELSYTYATGKVEVKGGTGRTAGGICGSPPDNLSNNLALNGEIIGSGYFIHRVRGEGRDSGSNYASTQTKVNGSPVHSNNPSSWDGANTWLDTFENDLKGVSDEAKAAWNAAWTWPDGKLPQLKMVTDEDTDGNPTYGDWTPGIQPLIDAAGLLPARPKLYIVQPAKGGKLQVFDEATGLDILDGYAVTPGITLSLKPSAANNYRFDGIYSGTTADDVTTPVSGTTIPMPAADLWLSAHFTYVAPPPPPTVYHTVTLPAVEGAVTNPRPGSYTIEAGRTFRFYLTLDTAYSESQPVVTTDRGETLTARSSDGAYLLKNVLGDVEIYIDGLYPNLPVANESITDPHAADRSALPRIWTEPSALCILLPDGFLAGVNASAIPIRILSLDGRLVDIFKAAPGLNRRQLPTGVYIVWIGDIVRKVVVRN